jgi:hypothetical protein
MSDEEPPFSKQDQLALAIAQGKSVPGWPRQKDVPRTTAFRWANDPDCRRHVSPGGRRCPMGG